MIIFPAIDILNGKVVRLVNGDYAAAKNYDVAAEDAARAFKAQGAAHLHVVDLDGARLGKAVNAAVLSRIVSATDMFVEIGGGIRTEAQIRSYLEAGAGRVVLGTAAVRDFAFTERMAQKYGEKIAVGVDALNGKVAISGWTETTDINADEFCVRLAAAGVRDIIYTDIACDGTLGGTDLDVYERLVGLGGFRVVASGGICSLSELAALKAMGVYAAVLGKALYENKLSLADAVATTEGNGDAC